VRLHACHAPRSTRASSSSSNIRLLKSPPFFLLHTQTTLYFTIPQDALRPSSPPLDLPTYLPSYLPSYPPQLPPFREFPIASTSSYTPRHPIPKPHHPLPLHPLLLNTTLICAPPETDLRTGKLLLFRCKIPSTSSSRVRSLSAFTNPSFHSPPMLLHFANLVFQKIK
jgi:hypothetical protein